MAENGKDIFRDIIKQVPVIEGSEINIATTRVYVDANGEAFYKIPLSEFYNILTASAGEIAEYARQVEALYRDLEAMKREIEEAENYVWGEF